MRNLSIRLILVPAAIIGCSRSSSESSAAASKPAATSSTVAVSAVTPASARAPQGSTCPRTGQWALCSVEKRLRQSGFVVRRIGGEPPLRNGFTVRPAAYMLGRSRLEVFIYQNESAASADVAKIDTVAAAPLGNPNRWGTPPTFARSANLLAVFLTDNPTQAERLTLALTAGPPQR